MRTNRNEHLGTSKLRVFLTISSSDHQRGSRQKGGDHHLAAEDRKDVQVSTTYNRSMLLAFGRLRDGRHRLRRSEIKSECL